MALTRVLKGPTVLMHLAAPESLMKRTQNHCQQRYLTNICVPYISYYVDILCLYVPYTSYINLGYVIYTLYLLLCRNSRASRERTRDVCLQNAIIGKEHMEWGRHGLHKVTTVRNTKDACLFRRHDMTNIR